MLTAKESKLINVINVIGTKFFIKTGNISRCMDMVKTIREYF